MSTNPKFKNSKNEPLDPKRTNGGIPRYSKNEMKKKFKKRGKIFLKS